MIRKAVTDGKFIYFIDDIRNLSYEQLVYPLDKSSQLKNTVYVQSSQVLSYIDLMKNNRPILVKAKVELSSLKECEKQNNFFALRTIDGGISRLTEIPEKIKFDMINFDHKQFLDESIFELIKTVKYDELVSEYQNYETNFLNQKTILDHEKEELTTSINYLDTKKNRLYTELEHIEQEFITKSQALESLKKELDCTETQFQFIQEELKHDGNILKNFIKKSAEHLLKIDLVNQNDIARLFGSIHNNELTHKINYKEIIDNTHNNYISHIQAYLFNKDIYYPRSLLLDYCTLLSTNDLIILAGDSGSGKTNLVKAFSEAVGGKSFIIPVKPNWTSGEDLLGYYNPIENKFISTQFSDALLEAKANPNIPYFICLDEMNLSRVEYYFADFLSLLVERRHPPQIQLYSDQESAQAFVQIKTFLELLKSVETEYEIQDIKSFSELLLHKKASEKLNALCGFNNSGSLLKYHSHLKKIISSSIHAPAKFSLPDNVRIIGAINIDETTHYLSPKILDRAYIMRFSNPLQQNWDLYYNEIKEYNQDIDLPLNLHPKYFCSRTVYPRLDMDDNIVKFFMELSNRFLSPLGIEFGLRSIRQAREFAKQCMKYDINHTVILNNFIIYKIMPKLTFDAGKVANHNQKLKIDVLRELYYYLKDQFSELETMNLSLNCLTEIHRILRQAEDNDHVVNYWLN